ncbi:MAG: hypothetical protein CMA00_004895 [Methanobacteriota archaeon]|nr:MAG: hypothetical protein CMA00_004895 [Euryarchaeota archaeon]|tara:strand:- start:3314 stop:5002 length:1689 start_codon:yes stop_codon:yes gene_type:complete
MERSKSIMISIILLASLVASTTNSSADGEDIIVESNMTWSGDMTLSQNVRILNGGSLSFVDSKVNISSGVGIYVDASSSLSLESSELSSTNPPSGLAGFGYCDEDNRSSVRVFSQSEQNIRAYLRPIQGFSLDGVVAYFGNETKDLSGEEDFIPLGSGSVDIWIGLTGPLCHPVSLSEISIERAGQERVWSDAADYEHRNFMVHGDPGFSIDIDGSMQSNGSSIFGGRISSYGYLNISDSSLDRVGPILLANDDASLVLGGNTKITNSTDDHDVRARAHSPIEWGDGVSGSGGLTDKWERRLSGQKLSFDAMYVTFEIRGMHKFPSYSNFSNELGISFVDGGKERVVEIAWSEDNTWEETPIWTENASVVITEYRTAWNPEASGILDYGGGQFDLPWEQEVWVRTGTPMIEWVSLTPMGEDGILGEASIGDSVNVEAVISNSGTAAASLAIGCKDSSGVEAQVSPQFPNAIIEPGTERTISFSWRSSSTGEDYLNCRVLTPTQLVEESAFGGGEMETSNLSWIDSSDDTGDERSILPALIVVLISAAIGGHFLFRIYREDEI